LTASAEPLHREAVDESAKPTLEDLARAAGISRTAASYALNGQPGVSDETRRHVRTVAGRIGYRHHGRSRQARPRSAGTLGAALSPTRHRGETPNYYVAELLAGAEGEARRQRFQVNVEMWTPERGPEIPAGIDGMLFLGGAFDPDLIARVNVPAVVVGTSFPQLQIDAVLADNRQGVYLAAGHLLDHGCRRVALLNGPARAATTNSKLIGYRDALQERGLEWAASDVRQVEFSVEAGEEAARSVLSGPDRPDGIVAGDDVIAVGALHAAADLGIRVPEELAVVGFGNSPTSALLRPPLSSIDVFLQQMGQIAVRRLLDRLGAPSTDQPFVRSLVNPRLVVRGSSEGAS
jgi:LacI family transcriptional regulator